MLIMLLKRFYNQLGTVGELKQVDNSETTAADLALAAEAKKEHESEKGKKKEDWEVAFEQDHPELIKKEEVVKEVKKEEKKEDIKKEEIKEDEKIDKEKQKEQSQKEEEKSEPLKKTDDKSSNSEEQIEEEEYRNFALKEGLTLADAKEELGKIKNIVEKYKNDPKELAKALRHTQSGYDKLRVEKDSLKEEVEVIKSRPVAPVSADVEVRSFVEQNRDKIIENYRKSYPAKTREMEDDVILEEVFDKTLTGYTNWKQAQQGEFKKQASQRREELLNSLSSEDKRFLPDIKVVIDKTSDTHLLSKSFHIEDIVYWAKGQTYDKEVKLAEERGYKRGLEQPRIIAELPKKENKSTTVKSADNKQQTALTNYQKERALEMYEGTTLTEDEKFSEYAKLLEKEKKKT